MTATAELRVPSKFRGAIPTTATEVSKNKSTITVEMDHNGMTRFTELLKTHAKSHEMTDKDKARVAELTKTAKGHAKRLKQATIATSALDLAQHPLGQAVPAMSDDEFAELVDSITTRGFMPESPIVLHEGMILDGWHRYRACSEAGVDPIFADYAGENPAEFVIALNVDRRHLSDDQRAAVAGTLIKDGAEVHATAQSVKVSANQATKARRIANHSDDLAELIREGHISIADGMDVIRNESRDELIAALEKAKKNVSAVQDIVKRAKEARSEQRADRRVTLALTGDEAWTFAGNLFDEEGNLLGEGYWRQKPPPAEEGDPLEYVAVLEEALSEEDRSDRAAIRKALKPCTDYQLAVLYYGFEDVEPPEDMSRAKIASYLVKKFLAYWSSDPVEDENVEDEDDD